MKLPARLTSIGYNAFRGCSGLTKVVSLNPTAPTLGTINVFEVFSPKAKLYVPIGSEDSYITEGWDTYFEIIETQLTSNIGNIIVRAGSLIVRPQGP